MGGHDLMWSWLLTKPLRADIEPGPGRRDALDERQARDRRQGKGAAPGHPDRPIVDNLALCLTRSASSPRRSTSSRARFPIVENGPRRGIRERGGLSNYSES